MLIENGQRADLSAIEEARGYQMALDLSDGDLTPAKLSKAVADVPGGSSCAVG